ncbi:hemolysin XhlA family protein [Priestia flexa]|uniref:hemolysin XhlA family protein n=1 Tax=Priestia flexa TaxID=86664 RepID=UPI0010FC17EB|nr:hemolysin XhlA family protein [Priestia flexa]QCS52393.1 protein xhlA [Priestia flexa]
MPNTTEVQPMDTFQKELAEIKSEQKLQSARINNLERTTDRHDNQIVTLNDKLNKIEENTTWIKRTIMGGIITAICTGVIGGAIAIFYTVLQQ